jgi:hypothetical protein
VEIKPKLDENPAFRSTSIVLIRRQNLSKLYIFSGFSGLYFIIRQITFLYFKNRQIIFEGFSQNVTAGFRFSYQKGRNNWSSFF